MSANTLINLTKKLIGLENKINALDQEIIKKLDAALMNLNTINKVNFENYRELIQKAENAAEVGKNTRQNLGKRK